MSKGQNLNDQALSNFEAGMTEHKESLPYQSHSETSTEAAVKKTDAGADRKIIFAMIRDAGLNGLTNDEISKRRGYDSSFYSPRIIELERGIYIIKLKATRKTRKGRNANVYVTPLFVANRPTIPFKKVGKMPDPMIEEVDRKSLKRFIEKIDAYYSLVVRQDDHVYNLIKRLAGV